MKNIYLKQFEDAGLTLNHLRCNMSFNDFKLNSDNMIPVVVQDHENNEVLMVAYMNEEAFDITVESGIMTYYSRSRDEIWIKGLTSGHYQYVKELVIDCDLDTLLAKVVQTGAACHTGNRTCFFTTITD
ncbi:MAG: phosphoribosyl-AMP cyclohydrolase [Lachnospiraceae bacterium]|nr:phosphoribosyl-AMP cyclohydrolase [Lachnospiraceae bacterium]